MSKEDELWSEYEQKKAELEERFAKKNISKAIPDEEYHKAFKTLYKNYYSRAEKIVQQENRKELERLKKNNKLLASRQGPFYSEKKEQK